LRRCPRRLTELCEGLFGLTLSQGAISNMLLRAGQPFGAPAQQIAATVRSSEVMASDETSARVKGKTLHCRNRPPRRPHRSRRHPRRSRSSRARPNRIPISSMGVSNYENSLHLIDPAEVGAADQEPRRTVQLLKRTPNSRRSRFGAGMQTSIGDCKLKCFGRR